MLKDLDSERWHSGKTDKINFAELKCSINPGCEVSQSFVIQNSSAKNTHFM